MGFICRNLIRLVNTMIFRNLSLNKKFFLIVVCGSLPAVYLFFFSYINSSQHSINYSTHVSSAFECSSHTNDVNSTSTSKHEANYSTDVKKKVLIIAEKLSNLFVKRLIYLITSVKMNIKISSHKKLPVLEDRGKGSFALFIFAKLEFYSMMDKLSKQNLEKYCLKYRVGLLIFVQTDETLIGSQINDYPLHFVSNKQVLDYRINDFSPILRITKPGYFVLNNTSSKWTLFYSTNSFFEPISIVNFLKNKPFYEDDYIYSSIMWDKGYDGIEKIFFNDKISFWFHKLLILDAISYLSHGNLMVPLERYILVDIDDIFVAQTSLKMKEKDVEELVLFQQKIREDFVENFTFNLGFSGKFYKQGSFEENKGDETLIVSRHNFTWFCHTWSHVQPHKLNLTLLVKDMKLNKEFAKVHNLPVNLKYSVAPHHSGVYPVHEDLYEAWKKVWGVEVTSTEEYPNLYPPKNRRGFIHKGIKVLPRQTCNLFTHTIFFDKYPGGRVKLDNSILGGDLFMTVITNIINIFMTHLSNYGNDRLALYTFHNLFNFIKCRTNLKMMTVEPVKLAELYFNLYPAEAIPIWSNPCENRRHKEIWSGEKTCLQLPQFIIVGPQKTGTTALYTYLNLHSQLKSNFPSNTSFEEVQFFIEKNYIKGIDWYMDHFPLPSSQSSQSVILYEKSANYFTETKAPLRIHTLIPEAKIICILIHPTDRAYSWYQHMLSHHDPTALKYSFNEIITAENSSDEVVNLRNKCLLPGMYAVHLKKWIDYFNTSQLLIVDGENLRVDPVSEMNIVQHFLNLQVKLDYSKILRYSEKKGFYCPVMKGKLKCLGSGKGRKYQTMDDKSKSFLNKFYKNSFWDLEKFLTDHNYVKPRWLIEELYNLS